MAEDSKRGFDDVSSIESNPGMAHLLSRETAAQTNSDMLLSAYMSDRRMQALGKATGFRPGDNMATMLAGSVLNSPLVSSFTGGSQVSLQAGLQDAFRMSSGMGGKETTSAQLAAQMSSEMQAKLFGGGTSRQTSFGMNRNDMADTAALFGSMGGMEQILSGVKYHNFNSSDKGLAEMREVMGNYRPGSAAHSNLQGHYESLTRANKEGDMDGSLSLAVMDDGMAEKGVKLMENFGKMLSTAQKVMKSADKAGVVRQMQTMAGGDNIAVDESAAARVMGRLNRIEGQAAFGKDTLAVYQGQMRAQAMLATTTGDRLYSSVAAEGHYNRAVKGVEADTAGVGISERFTGGRVMDIDTRLGVGAAMDAAAQEENPELAVMALFMQNMEDPEEKRAAQKRLKEIGKISDVTEQRKQQAILTESWGPAYARTRAATLGHAQGLLNAEGAKFLEDTTRWAVAGSTPAGLERAYNVNNVSREDRGNINELLRAIPTADVGRIIEAKTDEDGDKISEGLLGPLGEEYTDEMKAGAKALRGLSKDAQDVIMGEVANSALMQSDDNIVIKGRAEAAQWEQTKVSQALKGSKHVDKQDFINGFLTGETPMTEDNILQFSKTHKNLQTVREDIGLKKVDDGWQVQKEGLANGVNGWQEGNILNADERKELLDTVAKKHGGKIKAVGGNENYELEREAFIEAGVEMVDGQMVVTKGGVLDKMDSGFKVGEALSPEESNRAMRELEEKYTKYEARFDDDGQLKMIDKDQVQRGETLANAYNSLEFASDADREGGREAHFQATRSDEERNQDLLVRHLKDYITDDDGNIITKNLHAVSAAIIDPETGASYDDSLRKGLETIAHDMEKDKIKKKPGQSGNATLGWRGSDTLNEHNDKIGERQQEINMVMHNLKQGKIDAKAAADTEARGSVEGLLGLILEAITNATQVEA